MIIPRLFELYSADGTELCEGYANAIRYSEKLFMDSDARLEDAIENCKLEFEEEVVNTNPEDYTSEDYVEWVYRKYPVSYKIYLEHEEYVDYELVEEGKITIDNASVAEILKGAAQATPFFLRQEISRFGK